MKKPCYSVRVGENKDCLGNIIKPYYGKRRKIQNITEKWDIPYSEKRRRQIKKLISRKETFNEVFAEVRRERKGGIRIELKRDKEGIYGYE